MAEDTAHAFYRHTVAQGTDGERMAGAMEYTRQSKEKRIGEDKT